MRNLQHTVRNLIHILAILLFGWIAAVILSRQRNWQPFLAGIAGLLGVLVLNRRASGIAGKISYDRAVKFLTPVLFALQIYIMYNIFFETGWDSGIQVIPAAKIIARNGDKSFLSDIYFSNYPNNLLLVSLYAAVLKINDSVGIFFENYCLMAIVILNCAISTSSAVLIYKTGKKLLNEKYAFLGYLLGVCMLVLSPWNVICYSDPLALFFPVFIFWLYFSRERNLYKKYLLIFLLGYLGFCIKPQVLIAVIAIVCVELLRHLSDLRQKEFWKKAGKLAAMALAMLLTVSKLLSVMYSLEGFAIDREQRFGIPHYLMLGLNEERTGRFSDEDVAFSRQFSTGKELTKANFSEAGRRIKSMGAAGLMRHLSEKMLVNYGNGTFSWGGEGTFYMDRKLPPNRDVSLRLRHFYYNEGLKYQVFYGGEQTLWLMVLTLIFLQTVLAFRDRKRADDRYLVLILALVGLTVFELLFEARARYLYPYVPVYILAALYGLEALNGFWRRRKVRRRSPVSGTGAADFSNE